MWGPFFSTPKNGPHTHTEGKHVGKKLHLYDASDITRSVLHGREISAACGLRKVLSREDIDAAKDSPRPTCAGCLRAIGEKARQQDVTLRKPEGWTSHLKRQAQHAMWSYTITSSAPVMWRQDGFPLAG